MPVYSKRIIIIAPLIMSLEKDINQAKFRNDHQKVVINLVYTHNWLDQQLKDFFDKYELTQQQFNILRILRGAGNPLSTLQIRQRMLDKMSDTSRIVDRLVAKSFVKKCPKEDDKRKVDVSLAPKGRKLLEKIDLLSDEMDKVSGNLTEEEARIMNALLDKLRGSE
jgi:DNA-binding MarR family transcriptional regulator